MQSLRRISLATAQPSILGIWMPRITTSVRDAVRGERVDAVRCRLDGVSVHLEEQRVGFDQIRIVVSMSKRSAFPVDIGSYRLRPMSRN